jgi:hypothetical protein
MKLYHYIGPDELRQLIAPSNLGIPIQKPQDIINWLGSSQDLKQPHDEVITTFIINEEGILCLAERQTEHVVCAGGKAVLSAGEMTFSVTKNAIEVTYVTNQSTGYCPEPDSWIAVAKALNQLAISHPNGFSYQFIFRQCKICQTINIIKENLFICAVCGNPLI